MGEPEPGEDESSSAIVTEEVRFWRGVDGGWHFEHGRGATLLATCDNGEDCYPSIDAAWAGFIESRLHEADLMGEPEDESSATVYLWGAEAHDGPGYYYVDDEYPEEGSCGAFKTAEEAVAHARESYATVRVSGQPEASP